MLLTFNGKFYNTECVVVVANGCGLLKVLHQEFAVTIWEVCSRSARLVCRQGSVLRFSFFPGNVASSCLIRPTVNFLCLARPLGIAQRSVQIRARSIWVEEDSCTISARSLHYRARLGLGRARWAAGFAQQLSSNRERFGLVRSTFYLR